MKKTICYILFSISFSLSIDGEELSNDTLQLDVLQAIRIARTQSPDVLVPVIVFDHLIGTIVIIKRTSNQH